jgi:beta-lactamase regulating signal transducer with metallopeptidase domain
MIAAWMLYCLLCALGLAVAALIAERALLGGGWPVRHVWICAVALSLIIPALAFRFAPRAAATAAPVSILSDAVAAPTTDSSVGASPSSTVVTTHLPHQSQWTWRGAAATIARANRPLAIVWAILSFAFALYLVIGIIVLAIMRRRWHRQDVLGFPVLVSDRVGPAVVGAVSPAIVMPEWALTMEPPQLMLMLRHEDEHRRAGDAQLLTIAHLALIVMPWNAALWWVVVRLGMAVELDCDARVLRNADARSYGDLLLEVARPRRGPRLIAATAFAERAGQLERRIRAIARRRERASHGARAAATLLGLAAVGMAWVAPRPPAPPRTEPHIAPTSPAALTEMAQAPVADSTPALDRANPIRLPALRPSIDRDPVTGATRKFRGDSMVVAPGGVMPIGINPPTASPLPDRAGLPRAQSNVDSIFSRLFAGIPLTPDQATKAVDMIARLAEQQDSQDKANMLATVRSITARLAVQARRDSALRALAMSDADRTTLDARLSTMSMGGGRRGRSGSDSPAPAPNGIGGGRGGGRGRSGGGGPVIIQEVPAGVGSIVDAIYSRLFSGIALSPNDEGAAHTIIADAQREIQSLIPEPPMVQLRLFPTGGVLMSPEAKSALSALLTNDADRAVLESRIMVETRVVVRQPAPAST